MPQLTQLDCSLKPVASLGGAAHNLFLSSLSAALLTAIVCTLASQYREAGGGLEVLAHARSCAARIPWPLERTCNTHKQHRAPWSRHPPSLLSLKRAVSTLITPPHFRPRTHTLPTSSPLCGSNSLPPALSRSPPQGLIRIWCDQKPHYLDKGRLIFFYYINYLTKYYELIDTALLVLRGRPVAVFHMYHHACTLVLCWSQLHDNSACQWVPIVLNLLVHVSMYYYYAVATLGRNVWWKKYLTTSQIIQFAIDVPSCVLALLLRVRPPPPRSLPPSLPSPNSPLLPLDPASHPFRPLNHPPLSAPHTPLFPQWNAEFHWGWFNGYNTWCRGTYRGAYFGIGLLFSYLILFIQVRPRTDEFPEIGGSVCVRSLSCSAALGAAVVSPRGVRVRCLR